MGARRGLAPGGGRARWPGSALARAPRRSLCVARTPGTGDSHRHWLPPLALTRSPASPPPSPPRRPNPPARPDPSGRERARRAPGREGAAGGKGEGETGRAPQAAERCNCEAWKRAGTAAAAGGCQVGGGRGGKRWGCEKLGEGVLRPAHSLPFLFCLLPQRGHPTRRRGSWYPGVAGLNPPSSSSPCAAGTKAPRKAGPRAEAVPAARGHALGPRSRETRRDPGDSRPRGAARGVAPARRGVFGERRPPGACVRASDPRWGGDFSHCLPTPPLFVSVLGERVVILGPIKPFWINKRSSFILLCVSVCVCVHCIFLQLNTTESTESSSLA